MKCEWEHNGNCRVSVAGRDVDCGECPYKNGLAAVRCSIFCPHEESLKKLSSIEKVAAWKDVAAKGRAIAAAGGVEIVRDDSDEIEGYVMSGVVAGQFPVSDGGPYDTILSKGSWVKAPNYGGWIQGYLCDCDWGFYHGGMADGVHRFAGRFCCPPDELVLMADGTYKPIVDIRVGDSVTTRDGARPVSRLYERDYDGDIVSIRVGGSCFPLRVTPNHPVIVNGAYDRWRTTHKGRVDNPKSKGYRYIHDISLWSDEKNASDIKVGDLVLSVASHDKQPCVFDLKKIFGDSIYDDEGCATWISGGSHRGGRWKSFASCHTVLPLDYDLANIIGWYIAEGSVEGHNGAEIIRWSLSKNEHDVVDSLTHSLHAVGVENVRVQDYSYRGAQAVIVSCRPLAELLVRLCGTGSHDKHLSAEIMNAPVDVQRDILDAWTCGDGCVKGHATCKCLYTVSEILARQASVLVQRIYGVTASVHKNINSAGPVQRAQGIQSLGRYIYHVDFDAAYVQRRYGIDAYHTAVVVTSVDVESYHGKVYNLEVEDEHTYAPEGILVHNCSHSFALMIVANARARGEFMNDRTGSIYTLGECESCGKHGHVSAVNGLCAECERKKTFDAFVASTFCNSLIASKWLVTNGDDELVAKIAKEASVEDVDSGVSVVSWNGYRAMATPKMAGIKDATRHFTYAEMDELDHEIDGKQLHNRGRLKCVTEGLV